MVAPAGTLEACDMLPSTGIFMYYRNIDSRIFEDCLPAGQYEICSQIVQMPLTK